MKVSIEKKLRHLLGIWQVMHEDLRNVTHAHALHALRQTPNRVRLVIHREDDEIYETLEVELNKEKNRGLGLSIVGKKSGPGVFISEVVKGGAAETDGRLVQGDQVSVKKYRARIHTFFSCPGHGGRTHIILHTYYVFHSTDYFRQRSRPDEQ